MNTLREILGLRAHLLSQGSLHRLSRSCWSLYDLSPLSTQVPHSAPDAPASGAACSGPRSFHSSPCGAAPWIVDQESAAAAQHNGSSSSSSSSSSSCSSNRNSSNSSDSSSSSSGCQHEGSGAPPAGLVTVAASEPGLHSELGFVSPGIYVYSPSSKKLNPPHHPHTRPHSRSHSHPHTRVQPRTGTGAHAHGLAHAHGHAHVNLHGHPYAQAHAHAHAHAQDHAHDGAHAHAHAHAHGSSRNHAYSQGHSRRAGGTLPLLPLPAFPGSIRSSGYGGPGGAEDYEGEGQEEEQEQEQEQEKELQGENSMEESLFQVEPDIVLDSTLDLRNLPLLKQQQQQQQPRQGVGVGAVGGHFPTRRTAYSRTGGRGAATLVSSSSSSSLGERAPVPAAAAAAAAAARAQQLAKKPWQRTIGGVLDLGMRPGMVPSGRKPAAVAAGQMKDDGKEAAIQAEINKLWRRRGLGRNKVLPGPSWSMRRLKLARQEATKLERERERLALQELAHGAGLPPTAAAAALRGAAPLGAPSSDLEDHGTVQRLLQAQRDPHVASKVFQWAKQQDGFAPDGRAYTELIRICAWAGDAEAAEQLLKDMWQHEAQVDPDTVFLVLAAYAKAARFREPLALYEDSLAAQCAPHEATLALMVWMRARAGAVRAAVAAVDAAVLGAWVPTPTPASVGRTAQRLRRAGLPPAVLEVALNVRSLCAHSKAARYLARYGKLAEYRLEACDEARALRAYLNKFGRLPARHHQRRLLGLLASAAAASPSAATPSSAAVLSAAEELGDEEGQGGDDHVRLSGERGRERESVGGRGRRSEVVRAAAATDAMQEAGLLRVKMTAYGFAAAAAGSSFKARFKA